MVSKREAGTLFGPLTASSGRSHSSRRVEDSARKVGIPSNERPSPGIYCPTRTIAIPGPSEVPHAEVCAGWRSAKPCASAYYQALKSQSFALHRPGFDGISAKPYLGGPRLAGDGSSGGQVGSWAWRPVRRVHPVGSNTFPPFTVVTASSFWRLVRVLPSESVKVNSPSFNSSTLTSASAPGWRVPISAPKLKTRAELTVARAMTSRQTHSQDQKLGKGC